MTSKWTTGCPMPYPFVVRRSGRRLLISISLRPRRAAGLIAPLTSAGDVTSFDAWEMNLHGHRVVYRIAGNGPPVVLIHGMVNSSLHWEEVAMRLADDYTVIAPDLIGHGDSATPRGDYSLGAHAAAIRDQLAVLGI